MSESQNLAILKHLKRRGSTITPLEALTKFGSFRLGARIYDLRRAGYVIERVWCLNAFGNRYAKYRLVK